MRSFLFFLSVVFFSADGFAQTLKDSASILEVRKEPRHHDVVDNEWVRILDVRIPPGDTTLFHKHTTPSVFLVLGNTKTGSQALIEPRHRTFDKKDIWFEDFTDTPRIHRVWNADKVPFHTIDIELPHRPDPNFKGTDPKDSELLFDAKPVRAYRMKLKPGSNFVMNVAPCPIVVIGLEKGDYTFTPAGQPVFITNTGKSVEDFAVFEIK